MNKKRFTFTVAYDTPFFYDNDYPLEPKEVVNLLNELSEENASLKQRIRDIKYNNCGL